MLPFLRSFGFALLVALAGAWALAQPLPEADLKAQILWRALQFVEWPAEVAATQPLQLCLLASGPLAEALRDWDQRPLNGRRIELRRAAGAAPATAVPGGCHIAYVGPDTALPPAPPRGQLWVGDSLGLTERGVTFNLLPHQGRIVFDVDLHGARRAGLDVNARLLRLARFVRTEGSP